MSESLNRRPKNRTRVLVVDDDRLLLESLSTWLEKRCGVEVTTFASAEEAMTFARPESFDVCVLDYGLGGADGLTLGAMLREINPDANLILITGGFNSSLETLAIEHGFGRVLPKPVSPETLAREIAR